MGLRVILVVVLGLSVSCAKAGDEEATKQLASDIRTLTNEVKALREEMSKLETAKPAARPKPRKRRGPEFDKTYAIKVAGLPNKGNEDAPVTVVKAFEYACPACYRARPFTKQVLKEFGDNVRIVYKDFVVHPTRAWHQAFAACAAHQQGKWADMEELIWEKGFKARKFDRPHYENLAKQIGLNMTKFKSDYDGICQQITRANHAEMKGVGVSGTPTLFVNGKRLRRRQIDVIKPMIEAELAEFKKSGLKSGKAFYEKTVVQAGAKPRNVPLPQIPK